MSVWLLIGAGLLAWTVVSIAFGLFLGRIVSAQRRGGYIGQGQLTPFQHGSDRAA